MINTIDSFKKVESLALKEGISLYRTGKDLGFTSSFFSEWKRGKMMPKTDKFEALSKYFDVPIEYFLEE